jgi:hypothetical protein
MFSIRWYSVFSRLLKHNLQSDLFPFLLEDGKDIRNTHRTENSMWYSVRWYKLPMVRWNVMSPYSCLYPEAGNIKPCRNGLQCIPDCQLSHATRQFIHHVIASNLEMLTLSLLMSYLYIYVYGAPSKVGNLTSYIYIYMDEIFNGGFASWTVHFVNICVKNQQICQLFIQFINYQNMQELPYIINKLNE